MDYEINVYSNQNLHYTHQFTHQCVMCNTGMDPGLQKRRGTRFIQYENDMRTPYYSCQQSSQVYTFTISGQGIEIEGYRYMYDIVVFALINIDHAVDTEHFLLTCVFQCVDLCMIICYSVTAILNFIFAHAGGASCHCRIGVGKGGPGEPLLPHNKQLQADINDSGQLQMFVQLHIKLQCIVFQHVEKLVPDYYQNPG